MALNKKLFEECQIKIIIKVIPSDLRLISFALRFDEQNLSFNLNTN